MKKILTVLFALVAITASAQMPTFIGYCSYDAVMKTMPEYADAEQQIEALRKQYTDEMKVAEKEFNQKYELFLEQQQNMVPAIREKRQSELQIMMENNVLFRVEAEKHIAAARESTMKLVEEKLNGAIASVAQSQNLYIILNTDSNACPYINPEISIDVTEAVKEFLSNN